MQVYTEICQKLSVPGVGRMTWKMLFILPITGILSVPITKFNKASSSMPGEELVYTKDFSSQMNFCTCLVKSRGGLYSQERQKGCKEMSCRSRETQGKE